MTYEQYQMIATALNYRRANKRITYDEYDELLKALVKAFVAYKGIKDLSYELTDYGNRPL